MTTGRVARLAMMILAPAVLRAQTGALPPALILPVWRISDTALAVWTQPPRAGAKSDSLIAAVRSSMTEWNAQLLPVRMQPGVDSLHSGIRVVWVEKFDEAISGRTTSIDDGVGHLVSARVILAFKHSDGRVLSGEEARVLALHELGHALGLEHSEDSTTVMAPRVRVRNITAADRAAALRLYSR